MFLMRVLVILKINRRTSAVNHFLLNQQETFLHSTTLLKTYPYSLVCSKKKVFQISPKITFEPELQTDSPQTELLARFLQVVLKISENFQEELFEISEEFLKIEITSVAEIVFYRIRFQEILYRIPALNRFQENSQEDP